MNNILQPECLNSDITAWKNPKYVENYAFLDIVQITSISSIGKKEAKNNAK